MLRVEIAYQIATAQVAISPAAWILIASGSPPINHSSTSPTAVATTRPIENAHERRASNRWSACSGVAIDLLWDSSENDVLDGG